MKKTLYYSKDGNKLTRCILSNENRSICNYGNPVVFIKEQAYGAIDLAINNIKLYAYDHDAVEWGATQFYNIELLINSIRTARERSGLTQKELAEKVGVVEQYVQAWEYGKKKPNGANLLKLANTLDVPPEMLL